jgi:hypothetical protein
MYGGRGCGFHCGVRGKDTGVPFALGVVIAIGVIWVGMTLFMGWQKDLPTSGAGKLGAASEESARRSVSAQRHQAAFLRKTVWPVVTACGIAAVVLIVLINT